MIEIIKNGDPRKTDNFMQFQCENCGCVWKADHNDYKMQMTEWTDTLYTAYCPNCHEEVVIVESFLSKEDISHDL